MMPVGGTRESRDSPSHGGACGGNRLTKSPLLAPQIRRCDAYHCPSSHSLASEYSLASHRQSQREENIASSTIQDLRETFPYGPFHGCNSVYEGLGLQDDTLSTFATKESLSEASSLVTYTATLLNVLSLLQQKIQQLQAFVQLMAQGCGGPIAQQQAIAAGITSVISQLVAVIADMLQPSVEPTPQMMAPEHQLKRFSGEINGLGFNISPKSGPGNYFGVSIESSLGTSYGSSVEGTTVLGDGLALGGAISMSGSTGIGISRRQNFGGQGAGSAHCTSQDLFSPGLAYGINNLLDMNVRPNGNLATWNSEDSAGPLTAMEQYLHGSFEEHDSVIGMRDDDDDGEGENLSPGSYELVEMDAVEILAEHTHFCKICGKGFKRDANLRMHMRGHGDEYKTPAALARPDNSSSQMSLINVRRYSCPYVGCKRNKKHCKFQPLKTMLCVKNHYRRSHCPKELTCSKCKTKKFSVVADLKTHEKHCGRDKWQCSCGTTFSRKDKLFGHIGLFAGHTPALLPLHPLQEMDIPGTVGVSLCNGSGGFTTSNVSVPSLSSNEPAYPAGSGNIHFNHRNRLFIGTPIVAGSDPIVEVSNGYKICAEVATICQNGKLQNFGRVSGSFSPTDVNNTVMLRDSSHSPTDLASSPVYEEPHPNNLLQQVNGNTQGSPGAIQHSSGG